MIGILKEESQIKVDGISWDIFEFYQRYKNKIEEIINNNEWIKKEDKIINLFKELWLTLSKRNNELLEFLNNKYWLNFKKDFDFSWWIKLNKDLIDSETPKKIKDFFDSENKYTREEWNNIHSRWYWYYFNFEWLKANGRNFEIETSKYVNNIQNYYNDVIEYLSEFKWKDISELNENEKKILLIWLEHYKNILFLLQNFVNSVSNNDFFKSSVLNVSNNTFNNFFIDISDNEDFSKINEFIKNELEIVTSNFWDILLWIETNSKININNDENIINTLKVINELIDWSFKKQEKYFEKRDKKTKNWKKINVESDKKCQTRTNNKLIWKIFRITREEDNPIKQILTCINMLNKIPEDSEEMDLVWVLYWWIEMPYIMKYVLVRFWWKNPKNLYIKLLALSTYNNRNAKQVSTEKSYNILDKKNLNKNRLQVVLDDNLYLWASLKLATNIMSTIWTTVKWVSEVGLRRPVGSLEKLYESDNLSFLLSIINTAASITPLKKTKPWYINIVNKYIKQKLPHLIGNF